ncbi:hypothetical protein B0O99DRAFT_628961 [Bisporella sp. PMI_857]|nr:hypothetical protein B0O99DRAFT_628961 [Bisporella sp. PMI_857]
MVVFVDLDEETEPPEGRVPYWSRFAEGRAFGSTFGGGPAALSLEARRNNDDDGDVRVNPNKTAVAEALGCYPVVVEIASHIDLNTLDALSRTCRQIRVNLLQFRTQLITSTLHCENEDIQPDPEHTFRYRARASDWYFVEAGRDAHGVGKAGDCARDMVGSCRRCARVVCRNCTIKPPAPVLLRNRHRRLCKTCQKAPLTKLITLSASPQSSCASADPPPVITGETLKRAVCTCPSEGVWLCQPCGRNVRSADTDYEGIWKWRTRYLPSLGGLGVGIGEGDRGVECGRGGLCLAAREVEQETDCDAEDARFESDSRAASPSSSPGGSTTSSIKGGMGPGYARHEIEGIGGILKKKLVQMVKVGQCVPEYGDEKVKGRYLVREIEGQNRSWCGWCWRVVPGAKDREGNEA